MVSSKRISPAAINALKDALALIYWYKRDLRSFLVNSLSDSGILGRLNWDGYKREIVDQLVNFLARNQDKYLKDILGLIEAVCAVTDFSHLERLDNGEEKALQAQRAVAALRKIAQPHLDLFREKEEAEKRRREYAERLAHMQSFRKKLDELKERYKRLSLSKDLQRRGYELEKLLNELFALFDLDPKASFKLSGEQIDGAFTFQNIDYLLEAKWQQSPVSTHHLDSLASKVRRKLDNTLGLFVSINGFSPEAISTHSSGRPVLLLMDGSDLMAVLEGRIDLQALLLQKRRHASQTGNIYFRYQDMI
ncbi:hypothetical protein D6817_02710 [Candidatus Pacearchaeota archaeon]|nr:MAG: hypothetical protein D6817_02710 [Candidatus Pacearchaeota archaeon]